ncbi:MAG: low molecular weight phosphotyrosine protein phosphatase [Actinobacteria bacterium]|nr:low molecular weight phosphotyrosine protein phosphatase [Actinomycetota bacterium]
MTESTRPKFRIAVVCLGNICRSPIAEAVLSAHVDQAGLRDRIDVESAGTAGWHAGLDADHRARLALQTSGYSCAHSARQFDPSWLDDLDLVLGMDYQNVLDLRDLTSDPEQVESIRLYRSFDPALMHLPEDDPVLEVPDPYYGSQADFDAVVKMVENATAGIIDYARLELG